MDLKSYQLHSDYEDTYWWFLSRRLLFLNQVDKAAQNLSSLNRPLNILDYGCGTGINLSFLSKFGRVTGADIFDSWVDQPPKAVDFPRMNLNKENKERFHGFDIITVLDVIEHMEDDIQGLNEIRKFLSPSGQIIITVPACPWLWSGEDIVSHHKRRYTKRRLQEACQAAGLEILFISYFNLLVLPLIAGAIWFHKIFFPAKSSESNLRPINPLLNKLLFKLSAVDNGRVGAERWRLPLGASLICRARIIRGSGDGNKAA